MANFLDIGAVQTNELDIGALQHEEAAPTGNVNNYFYERMYNEMSIILRQSTASQDVMIGAFIDDTDFKTPETGLTIANTDIKLLKDGGASVNKNSGGATQES